MTAQTSSALLHRFTVPAWLLALVIAAVVASAATVVLIDSDEPAPAQAGAGPNPWPPQQQPTICARLDGSVVGRC